MEKTETTFHPTSDTIRIRFSEGGWTRECDHTYYEVTAWRVMPEGACDLDMDVFYTEYEDGRWDVLMNMSHIPDATAGIWEDYATACVDADECLTVRQTMMVASTQLRANLVDQLATNPIAIGQDLLRMLNAWDAYLLDALDEHWLDKAADAPLAR